MWLSVGAKQKKMSQTKKTSPENVRYNYVTICRSYTGMLTFQQQKNQLQAMIGALARVGRVQVQILKSPSSIAA
jgi:hypothetical protein